MKTDSIAFRKTQSTSMHTFIKAKYILRITIESAIVQKINLV